MEKKKLKRIAVISSIVIVFIVLAVPSLMKEESIESFEECVAAGYPVMESMPRKCSTPDGGVFVEATQGGIALECESLGGNWIASAQECEGISEETCINLNGDFDPCASACRNDPEAEMCTLQCVQVCSFKGKTIGGQRDEHGCLGPAGYTWDDFINACTRDWEINNNSEIRAAKSAVDYFGQNKGLTVTDVSFKDCEGCYQVTLDLFGEKTEVTLENWEVVES